MSNGNAVAPPTPPTLPAPAVGRLEPLRPLPLSAVQRAMTDYQQGLHAVLDGSDWQSFIGSDGREQQFVKRSGWRKVAMWFGLDLRVGMIDVERDERGNPLRVTVTGRAVAPNGRIAEDVGACSADERRFSKPEHDLVSTATTRALNRAIANLVGMGELSLEELDEPTVAAPLPEWAQPADIALEATMIDKAAELIGEQRAKALARAIHERYGYVPNVTTGFVNAIHSMLAPELKTLRGAAATTTAEGE